MIKSSGSTAVYELADIRPAPKNTYNVSYLTRLTLWQENVSKSSEILVRKK